MQCNRKKEEDKKMDAANANAGAGADELLRERPHSAPTRAKGPGRPRGPSQKFKGLTPRPRSSRRRESQVNWISFAGAKCA